LACHHASGEPAPEAEEVRKRRVEIDAAMGLAPVEVERHGHDGELGDDQHIDQHADPTGSREALVQEVEYRIKHEGALVGSGTRQGRQSKSARHYDPMIIGCSDARVNAITTVLVCVSPTAAATRGLSEHGGAVTMPQC